MEHSSKFEIGTAEELQKKYGLYAENRRAIKLDPTKVPESLRHLIPWAETYGVSCDITRHDLGAKTPEAAKANLSTALLGFHPTIIRWIAKKTSDEAFVFMALCIFELEECGGPGLPGEGTDIDAWYASYLSERKAV